jgi:hypothetical protein
MSKLPSISDSKKTKSMDMDKLNEYAKEKASLAKKKREDARATALERLQQEQEQEKSRASAPKWADARSMEPDRKKSVDSKRSPRPSHQKHSTKVDIENLEDDYSLPLISKHPSTKSKKSTTIDPFEEVQGSVASLLKSVRSLKLGGKRTKKARKNHKKTRKATSHKNRRHSAKK